MRHLRKTLWGIALVLLLQLLKKLFDRLFPEASMFHHSLLSSMQVVVLLWLVLAILSGLITRNKPVTRKKNWRIFVVLFCLLAIPEMLVTYWLYHPSRIPSSLLPVFRQYYGAMRVNIIQFNPGCSVYDSSLLYTLKPSSRFVFENYEFSDAYYTNSMGLRDDESSLVKPDIICLGDSYAMGWGVPQNETFPELLGSQWGKKVLNTAISSYGTARELKNLYRMDTSNLQNIIIQYCRNDAYENREFVEQHYSLKISPKETYTSSVNLHYWNKLWFPGKHIITLSKIYGREKLIQLLPLKRNEPVDSSADLFNQSITDFADILLHSAINFKKCKVYVVEINDFERITNDFPDKVKALIASSPYAEHFNNNLVLVPMTGLLSKEDFYIFDGHIRPSGHRKIAKRLGSYMFPGK